MLPVRDRPRASRLLSVVVPVHQGGDSLRRSLEALERSDIPRARWELIVVDDASTDGSGQIAAASADVVIRLNGQPRGPAYARNRGFEASRGSFVAFVDSDVVVRSDALSKLLDGILHDPSMGAIVGAYDAERTSGRLLSEYRNLLRHCEHELNSGTTDAFAAGLAIVRPDAFTRAGMFDEWRFPRPQAEALEFGERLLGLGYRIERRADAQATHLKQWTFRHWLRVDLLDRGMSIAWLNQSPEFRTRADRLYLSSPLDAALAWTTVFAAVAALWRASPPLALFAFATLLLLVARNARLFGVLARARGIAFAAASVPIHLVMCAAYGVASAMGRTLFYLVGEPQPDPVTQAFAEVGMRTWPPVPLPSPVAASRDLPPDNNGAALAEHEPLLRKPR